MSKVPEGKIMSISYPIFAMDWVAFGEGEKRQEVVVVAGGGGASKTGVKNCVTLACLETDGKKPILKNISVLDTGSDLVSNITVSPKGDTIVCGVNSSSYVYSVSTKNKELKLIGQFETDFAKDSSYQNAVRFCPSSEKIATGGDDGIVRVWSMLTTKSLLEKGKKGEKKDAAKFTELAALKGHSASITDVAWHSNGSWLASSSKDGCCFVWDVKTSKKVYTLPFAIDTVPEKYKKDRKFGKYIYRGCRFCKIGDQEFLITLQTPSRGVSFLSKWLVSDTKSDTPGSAIKRTDIGNLSACSLATSEGYIGVGSSDGSITVFDAISLNRLRTVQGHYLPVTGIAFRPPSENKDTKMKKTQMLLLSSSADYSLHVTHVQGGRNWNMLLLLFLLIVLSFLFLHFRQ